MYPTASVSIVLRMLFWMRKLFLKKGQDGEVFFHRCRKKQGKKIIENLHDDQNSAVIHNLPSAPDSSTWLLERPPFTPIDARFISCVINSSPHQRDPVKRSMALPSPAFCSVVTCWTPSSLSSSQAGDTDSGAAGQCGMKRQSINFHTSCVASHL